MDAPRIRAQLRTEEAHPRCFAFAPLAILHDGARNASIVHVRDALRSLRGTPSITDMRVACNINRFNKNGFKQAQPFRASFALAREQRLSSRPPTEALLPATDIPAVNPRRCHCWLTRSDLSDSLMRADACSPSTCSNWVRETRYALVPTTWRYAASTRVVPSVAVLFRVHSAVRSACSASRPSSFSDEYARLVGP